MTEYIQSFPFANININSNLIISSFGNFMIGSDANTDNEFMLFKENNQNISKHHKLKTDYENWISLFLPKSLSVKYLYIRFNLVNISLSKKINIILYGSNKPDGRMVRISPNNSIYELKNSLIISLSETDEKFTYFKLVIISDQVELAIVSLKYYFGGQISDVIKGELLINSNSISYGAIHFGDNVYTKGSFSIMSEPILTEDITKPKDNGLKSNLIFSQRSYQNTNLADLDPLYMLDSMSKYSKRNEVMRLQADSNIAIGCSDAQNNKLKVNGGISLGDISDQTEIVPYTKYIGLTNHNNGSDLKQDFTGLVFNSDNIDLCVKSSCLIKAKSKNIGINKYNPIVSLDIGVEDMSKKIAINTNGAILTSLAGHLINTDDNNALLKEKLNITNNTDTQFKTTKSKIITQLNLLDAYNYNDLNSNHLVGFSSSNVKNIIPDSIIRSKTFVDIGFNLRFIQPNILQINPNITNYAYIDNSQLIIKFTSELKFFFNNKDILLQVDNNKHLLLNIESILNTTSDVYNLKTTNLMMSDIDLFSNTTYIKLLGYYDEFDLLKQNQLYNCGLVAIQELNYRNFLFFEITTGSNNIRYDDYINKLVYIQTDNHTYLPNQINQCKISDISFPKDATPKFTGVVYDIVEIGPTIRKIMIVCIKGPISVKFRSNNNIFYYGDLVCADTGGFIKKQDSEQYHNYTVGKSVFDNITKIDNEHLFQINKTINIIL